MLGWDNSITAVELYTSLVGKAAMKVKEVIENADSTGNVSDMGKLWILHFCTLIIVSRNICDLQTDARYKVNI